MKKDVTKKSELAVNQPPKTPKNEMMPAEAAIIQQSVGREIPMIPEIDKAYRYRLSLLGKIHLGYLAVSQSGKEYPKAAEYFVLPDKLATDTKFQAALVNCGNEDPTKPTMLPIILPCNVIAGNFSSSADRYGASRGLICRSYDGVTCRIVDQTTGELREKPCGMRSGACKYYASGECRWIHRLRFMLPDAEGFGVWQIDTTSDNNRANLLTEMTQIKSMLNGRLAGIDLLLTLEPREFSITINDKPAKVTCHLLHIRSNQRLRELVKGFEPRIAAVDSSEIEEFDTSIDDLPTVMVDDDDDEPELAPEPEPEQTPRPTPAPNPNPENDNIPVAATYAQLAKLRSIFDLMELDSSEITQLVGIPLGMLNKTDASKLIDKLVDSDDRRHALVGMTKELADDKQLTNPQIKALIREVSNQECDMIKDLDLKQLVKLLDKIRNFDEKTSHKLLD